MIFIFLYCHKAANKGWSIVNYHQNSAFDQPYWSCNDYCNGWLFQENFLLILTVILIFTNISKEVLLNNFELVYLEFKPWQPWQKLRREVNL